MGLYPRMLRCYPKAVPSLVLDMPAPDLLPLNAVSVDWDGGGSDVPVTSKDIQLLLVPWLGRYGEDGAVFHELLSPSLVIRHD